MVQRRQWHGAEWSLFIILIGTTVISLLYILLHLNEFQHASVSITIVGILISYLLPLLFWRPNYINPTLYPIAVLLTNAPMQIYLSWAEKEAYSLINCPLMIIGFLTDRKNAWWIAPIFLLIVPFSYFFFLESRNLLADVLGQTMNAALAFAIGISLQRVVTSNEKTVRLLAENQHQYMLIHEQNKALEQYANQIEHLTLLEERNRMARELHDTVGHTFTSVIMGMDAVAYLIEASPEKAKEKLDVLRNVTRSGLEEVRRSIHQMVPDGGDMLLSYQLTHLTGEFSLHTGTQIRFMMDGDEYELAKQTQLSLIRCLQESLTNAKRHGRATAIEVKLVYCRDQVALTIEDNGVGAEQLKAGFGISAMQERIAALQGTLQVRSVPDQGTVVSCKIPARRQPAF